MLRMASFLAVLLLPLTVLGQVIDVPAQVEPYAPVVASVKADADVYLWESSSPTVSIIPIGNGKTVHIWAPPGTHKLRCLCLTVDVDFAKETKSIEQKTYLGGFVVGSPSPGPNPNPTPGPIPEPPPVTIGPKNILLIHESADDTPAFADALVDLMVGEPYRTIRQPGHKLWILDDDEEAVQPWLRYVNNQPLPVLIFSDPVTKKVEVVPCPQAVDGVLATVKQHGG